ncbi:hypothetical protein [Virgisporangium aurantiacum]|uniref:Uncharacterized protein n=1 Tax=Virgisporangium aurantiacum TaxID=175570 RepID=A0A8J3Z0P6_9ACTN|nr:hypothetical protein [Virgisporangium aurantiacum]GIJ55504.1 hypothetical protein Vau01_030200 [Virgisporangium aurantiacum]
MLDWFRHGWDHAHDTDPYEWVDRELGGNVYGLDSIFDAVRKRNLPRPHTIDDLRDLLHEHLYVEADDKADYIRLGERGLRVRTDDDEVDLAYYFIDDGAVVDLPDRLAFLVHDTWPLPGNAAAAGASFSHGVPVRTVQLGAAGPDCVFSVRLGWDAPDTYRNLDLAGAVALPGLTLPDLAAHLGGVDTSDVDGWPHELRLLRDLITPGDDDLTPALHRYARLPGYHPSPAGISNTPEHDGSRPHPPTRSLVRVDTHIAQVARHIDDFFGFDQWFLFDTRWAAAHPDLARSLLRYTAHWDPFQT